MLILIIAGGPDKGRIYELTDGEPIVLGREGDQVKLNDPKVSREHARLWSEGGQWYLKDLGSRHGTYRNHNELEKGQHAKLKDGDYLQIGNTVMVLGRMAAGSTEKAALLAGGALPSAPRRRGLIVAGGLSVAALLALGGYLAVQLHELRSESVPREALTELEQRLLASEQQRTELFAQQTERLTETIDREAAERSELIEALEETAETVERSETSIAEAAETIDNTATAIEGVTDPILQQLVTANANAQQQQQALARLGEMITAQQEEDGTEELLAAVTQVQAMLADQPDADRLAAMLQESIQSNAQATGQAVQQALAEHQESLSEQQLASAEQTEALLNRLMEGLAQVPTRAQLAEEVRLAVAESRARDDQFMRLFLAELRNTGQQITTDITAAVDEDAQQARQLLAQITEELNQRPTGEQLADQLNAAVRLAMAEQETGDSEQMQALMRQVLEELEQRPTSEQLAADLRRVIGEDAQRTELLVARVLGQIDQQPTAQQIAMELQASDNETAAQTAALMETLLERVDEQQQLMAEVAELREEMRALPGRNSEAVREVLARLEAQDRNNTEVLEAIAELRSQLPEDLPDQLELVLSRLDEQVRTEQITDAIETSVQRIATARDEQTQTALAALTQRLDAMPSAEQLAQITENQDQLAELLDQSDTREAVSELRTALQQLAERSPGEDGDERLDQIIELLEQRERADLMLAELHDAMESQSEQTTSLRQDVIEAIQGLDQTQSQEELRELLSLVRDRLITDESIRQAIRDEMRGSVLPQQMALDDAREISTNTGTGGEPGGTPAQQQRLTQLELAYKQSFETGQPVTVGAGIVDPVTGEISRGRLIDPAIARAQGFESWRDWYLADRQAERLRNQHQALLQRNQSEAESGGTISLPPANTPAEDETP